jgi:Zn-dependent protease with chaperone function
MIDPTPYRHEPVLFRIALVVSIVLWLVLLVGTVGFVLLCNAVRISTEQYPEIYSLYLECCARLEMDEEPRLYLLQSEGLLNALACRFLRRNYVVLYSTVVDALKSHPDSLRFYLGHELCHVKRGHLGWSFWLFPAKLMPLLGAAYARARESSCDRYGLACSSSPIDALRALAVIASGNEQWRKLNVRAFQDQALETGGFWMSYHELTSGYPWLCKRVARVAEAAGMSGEEAADSGFPRRHWLAWVLGALTPNIGLGYGSGVFSLLWIVVVIGILAAVAIPAYQDYVVRAKVQQSLGNADGVSAAIGAFVQARNALPPSLDAIDVAHLAEGPDFGITLGEGGAFTVIYHGPSVLEGATIEFVPFRAEDQSIRWRCTGGTLQLKFRPPRCRSE